MTPKLLLAAGLALWASMALAEPKPAAPTPPIPAARPIDYPGVIDLKVDVSDTTRKVFRVTETIPVTAGPLVLSLPKWIPGEHSPSAQIVLMSGFTITADDGRRVEWRRDPVEMTAFHVDVPAGVRSLTVRLEQPTAQPGGPVRIAVTPNLVLLKWTAVALYPAGHEVSRIRVRPSLTVPKGWSLATALDGAETSGATTRFSETSFETLMDSPVYAGRHKASFDLDPGSPRPVRLNVFADAPKDLKATPAQIEIHRRLVQQADKLFGGARNFDHYDFLLSLNPTVGYLGAEHQRSSENGYSSAGYFTAWDSAFSGRDILAHEYVHAWNGKHRRPADLWTPDYTTPMRNSLLWVYEGLTEYYGDTLATRSGLYSSAQMRQRLALIAANAQATPGRSWRGLRDTTNAYIMNSAGGTGSTSWLRSLDYYEEGQMLWLDVDTLIRERTNGARSLDDFARAFFGVDDGDMRVSTYTFEDVVAALHAVAPYDWAHFLNARLDAHDRAPLDGLTRSGWSLAFEARPSAYVIAYEKDAEASLLTFSLGAEIGWDGAIKETLWNGPLFQAGVIAGARIVKVAGKPYSPEALKAAIVAAAKPGAPPISLSVEADDRVRPVRIPYHLGPRYPTLKRVAETPDRLGQILSPR
ncbi:M61 family peptidase [Caulobacter segnis]|uniref:M61 family metallopeptidase n=1 Tax=Caulobacter segnis TaxID=88688 RepID=UPI0028596F1C|nr:M61 family peptidase [Caulobacter segnis]MDR6625859.1 putative metalloprotease with PDZ domain [Caulobacter segnis]